MIKILKILFKPLILMVRKLYKYLLKTGIRLRLKNKDFTLITSTCIGGVIYNLCGRKFDSPTIDLWIKQPEFYEFCSNLDYYLKQDLHFINVPERNCPVAEIGGVKVIFVHYKTEQEAREKWEIRKKRIHWDNLYIITSDGNGATLDDFKKLDRVKCKRKIIFTSKYRPEIKDSFCLKSLSNKDSAAEHMIVRNRFTGLWTWLDDWDFVAWLNDKNNFAKR